MDKQQNNTEKNIIITAKIKIESIIVALYVICDSRIAFRGG